MSASIKLTKKAEKIEKTKWMKYLKDVGMTFLRRLIRIVA